MSDPCQTGPLSDRCQTRVRPASDRRATSSILWRREGRIINVVRLTPVEGGRREGYRTFSRKTAFPADSVGRWTVDVMTASGQLIGRLRFRVVE